ncbi:MAG: patatin-like phospholipase family protein [Alphaproteobacteria bacterium]|nr:patatin-like phospholipase family protein [Alphaproteobacteria bacterium]
MAKTKTINLALQGGGAHGAFSWGVIDRLLEQDGLEVECISGASAGAMNAVALADGLSRGGKEGARERLRLFWEKVGAAARLSPMQRTVFQRFTDSWSLDHSPGYLFFDLLSRVASPYDINPLDLNPLRDVMCEVIDFDNVCNCKKVKVYVSATNVETGRSRVFGQPNILPEHVMASAALPTLFKAVMVDGEPYWDGGYMGNPPLWPIFDNATSDDVLIVQINPFRRPEAPRAARDIVSRLNEITFNASLLRELRSVEFINQLIEEGRLEGTGYRNAFVHMIEDENFLAGLGASSKLNAEEAFIDLLFEKGRAAAEEWLDKNFDAIGKRSSFDIPKLFEGDHDALDGERLRRAAHFQVSNTGTTKRPPQ